MITMMMDLPESFFLEDEMVLFTVFLGKLIGQIFFCLKAR